MAGEAQAKLNVLLRELMETFEGSRQEEGDEENEWALMRSYFDKNQYNELVELCEAYGHCKPFIDHDVLAAKLKNCFYAMSDCLQIERKNLNKRLNILKADQKADKEVVNKVQNQLDDVDERIIKNYANCIRVKHGETIPIKIFIENEKFSLKNNPDHDPMVKGVEQTVRRGYVIVYDKSENKTYHFKQEEYRKFLSLHRQFPASKT